jgi:hypothetical protein
MCLACIHRTVLTCNKKNTDSLNCYVLEEGDDVFRTTFSLTSQLQGKTHSKFWQMGNVHHVTSY